MTRRSTLTDRIRRVSTTDVFRRSSRPEASVEPVPVQKMSPLYFARSRSVPDTLYTRPREPSFLTLPTEILAEVLSFVDFETVCAIRLSCRTAHHLLIRGDVVRRWLRDHISFHQISLYAAPSLPTFGFILEQQRRLQAVSRTAQVLVDYIEREILRHTLRRANIDTDQYRQGLLALVKIRLKERMTPLLFTIQAYLELKATNLLVANVNHHDDPPKIARERTFLNSLAPPHLHQTHKCYLFLTWLSNQILSRPSYAGTMERTMRGWLSDPLDAANYRRYFLLGGLGTLTRLVQLPSYKHRRKAVEAYMRELDPEQSVGWREKWRELGVGGVRGVVPGREDVRRILAIRVGEEECWVRDARSALGEHGLLEEGEEIEVGTPWQTMDFLCDIAGYDVLHTPPSWTGG